MCSTFDRKTSLTEQKAKLGGAGHSKHLFLGTLHPQTLAIPLIRIIFGLCSMSHLLWSRSQKFESSLVLPMLSNLRFQPYFRHDTSHSTSFTLHVVLASGLKSGSLEPCVRTHHTPQHTSLCGGHFGTVAERFLGGVH